MGLFGRSGRKVRQGNGATVIAEGSTIRGEIEGLKGPLYVEGTIEGIVVSEAEVIVGPRGRIEGAVKARHLVVNGEVEGRVVCEQLDIMAAGTVRGELHAGHMTIEDGGRFLGQSRELGDPDEITIVELKVVEPERLAALHSQVLAAEARPERQAEQVEETKNVSG